MQQLAIIKDSGQTAKSSSTGKKGKTAGNTPKTAKNKSQFTEILGLLALTPQLTSAVQIKQSGHIESAAAASNVKYNGDVVAVRGKGSETAGGKTISSQVRINAHAAVHAENSNISEAAGTETSVETTNKLINSSNLMFAREINSRIAKLNLVSAVVKGTDETMSAIFSGEEKQSATPGEIKIADLMSRSNLKTPDNRSLRAANQKTDLSDEAASSRQRVNSTAANQGESTGSPKETGSESTGKQPQVTKLEFSLAAGENGLVKAESAETNGMNAVKPMLSQSQTDYLVSKMIQQINVAPSSLEVSLKPEYLGKLSILVKSVEGAVAVNVIAQNSEALHLLNSNLHNIRSNLEQQGINVQQMEVNLAFQEKQGQQGSSYKGERRAVQETENLSTGMDYDSIPYQEQSSALSYQLNLLA